MPKKELRSATIKLAKKLMTKSPNAVRYTKEAIRAVRFMGMTEAKDYLAAKNTACKASDTINGRNEGIRQFIDEKTYRPGLGQFDTKLAAKRAKAKAKPKAKARAKSKAKPKAKARGRARAKA